MKDYSLINLNTGVEKRIFESLIELMETKSMGELTTTDILKKANISRSTFYRHYLDKYDVLSKSYDLIEEHYIKECNDSVVYGYQAIFKLFRDYANFFSHALRNEGQNCLIYYVADKMYARLSIMLSDHGINMKETCNKYMLRGFIHGALQVVYTWVNEGASEDEHSILHIIGKLMPKEVYDIIVEYYA